MATFEFAHNLTDQTLEFISFYFLNSFVNQYFQTYKILWKCRLCIILLSCAFTKPWSSQNFQLWKKERTQGEENKFGKNVATFFYPLCFHPLRLFTLMKISAICTYFMLFTKIKYVPYLHHYTGNAI